MKNYLLDTNVLMSNPNALFNFEDNNVYLCGTVLQELDKHKHDDGEQGYNARETVRLIINLIKTYLKDVPKENRLDMIKQGIPLPNGGKLCFEPDGVNPENLPKGYDISVADNRIISSCISMNDSYLKDNPVTLLTNDGGCFINALLCDVNADTVKSEQVKLGYSGHLDLEIEDWTIIDKIYKEGLVSSNIISELTQLKYPLVENQFVTITSGNKSVLTVHQNNYIIKINDMVVHDGIKPLNKMQQYAMWALTNPNIPLVILEGPAGTAKTFLSLACGLHQLKVESKSKDYEIYSRILISRPNTNTSDADFGYLPGTLEEKMGPLVASYMDNLEVILGDKNTPIKDTREIIDDMIRNGFIEFCPLYSIRGRSISNAFLICDEAQNASKLLIKDVITRPSQNTKVIIAGDPTQVDKTSLNKENNGLVYAKDCMKGSPLCAIIRFEENHCVRSPLAEEAIKRMK